MSEFTGPDLVRYETSEPEEGYYLGRDEWKKESEGEKNEA